MSSRRNFLKAMGFTGLLSLTNLKTLAAGPEPGCQIVHGWIHKRTSIWIVAGMDIPAGSVVTIRGGRAYLCRSTDPPAGITINAIRAGHEVETATAGKVYVRTGEPK